MANEKPVPKVPKKKWAPLSGGFMLISILGLVISAYLVKNSGAWDPSWAFAFLMVFAAMFVASLISMRSAPLSGLK